MKDTYEFSGRYIKALVKEAMYIERCVKGDLFEIINDDKCILLKDDSKWSWRLGHKDIELMPEGFDPNNINKELEIEIW